MDMPKLKCGPILPNVNIIPNVNQVNFKDIIDSANLHNSELKNKLDKIEKEKDQKYKDSVKREERIIELLESIDENTSLLSDIFKSLNENNDNQKEIIDIINQFNNLSTINNMKKAESSYRKIMKKIGAVVNDIELMNKLFAYGRLVYTSLHSIGKI